MYNWVRIYNRLFALVDQQGECYFSGPRFIDVVREVDPYFLTYGQYMQELKNTGESTSRRDYFYRILSSFDDERKVAIVNSIVDHVRAHDPEKTSGILAELGGTAAVPRPQLGEIWNSARLAKYLAEIDNCISTSNFERALTLAYSCLEGFLKAYCRENVPEAIGLTDIVALTKAVRTHLRQTVAEYPDEAFTALSHIGHTVDRARNRFSESHFDAEAARWLAVFVRDLVNSEIRLLMHFMGGKIPASSES